MIGTLKFAVVKRCFVENNTTEKIFETIPTNKIISILFTACGYCPFLIALYELYHNPGSGSAQLMLCMMRLIASAVVYAFLKNRGNSKR
jgi:hypothetical protein